jgi:hypothetical protein
VRQYLGYLDARHAPEPMRVKLRAVLNGEVNMLSREVQRTPMREVQPWLWAVKIDDYHWSRAVWDDLARVDPYYYLPVTIVTPDASKKVEGEEPPPPKQNFIPAPWLPPDDVAELIKLVGSKAPIVRADVFFAKTCLQTGQDGHGYYDFLGLGKKLADAEKLAGLDRAAAIAAYRELAAIIATSGVTLSNRQLFRFQTITGSWWESRDVKLSVDAVEKGVLVRRDALVNYLDDFKPDAFEIVATLPNDLPFFFLANGQGERQDTAPDFIASDFGSTNNDRRIHCGYSCMACHVDGGLRPFKDYGRHVYNQQTGLGFGTLALDPVKSRRANAAYLGPIHKAYDKDTKGYADALEEVTGLKPAEFSKAWREVYAWYQDEPVTAARLAAELGLAEADFLARLRKHATDRRGVDPVLAAYLPADPFPVRRESVEGRFGLVAQIILMGVNP